MRKRIAIFFLVISCLLPFVGLTQAQEELSVEPRDLLETAVDHLQAADSFSLAIDQTGKPYPLALTFDGVNMLPATLESAEAQYISPDELHISALVHLFIPLSLDIFSQDDRQWLSFPSGAPWFQLPEFEDFDVNRLLAPDDGIEYVISNLQDPQFVEDETLIDEQATWHLHATAAGDVVEGLLFGFIDPQDDVEIDAYIDIEDGHLVLIEILMLETAGDSEEDPSVWHIKFYDYDAPRGFDPPSG